MCQDLVTRVLLFSLQIVFSTHHAIQEILLKVHGDYLFCRTFIGQALFCPVLSHLRSQQYTYDNNNRLTMASIFIFVVAMVTILDGWPIYLPLQPRSPQLDSSSGPAQINKHQHL